MAIPIPDLNLEDVNFELSTSSGASGGTNVFQAPQAPQWMAGTTQRKDWLTGGPGASNPFPTATIGGVNPLVLLAIAGGGVWLFMRGRK